MSSTKIRIAAATMLAAAGLSVTAALTTTTANASPAQDAAYVACVALDGLYNDLGPDAQAQMGRLIAADIMSGVRDPLQESFYLSRSMPQITQVDANWLVNCATDIYLGFGPLHGTDVNGYQI